MLGGLREETKLAVHEHVCTMQQSPREAGPYAWPPPVLPASMQRFSTWRLRAGAPPPTCGKKETANRQTAAGVTPQRRVSGQGHNGVLTLQSWSYLHGLFLG